MPNRKDHMKRSLARYGHSAEEIHSFLDEPVRTYGRGHREFRHDTDTMKLVGNLFGSKYTREIAENIALDHIMADHEEEIAHRIPKEKPKVLPIQVVVVPPTQVVLIPKRVDTSKLTAEEKLALIKQKLLGLEVEIEQARKVLKGEV